MHNNIDKLLDKYWAVETSLEDEKLLRQYFSSGEVKEEHLQYVHLFDYFTEFSEVKIKRPLDLSFTTETSTETTKPKQKSRLRYLIPRVAAVAATLLLLFMITPKLTDSTDATYKNRYTEVQDPEEALEITMEALAFLGVKYDKGVQPMSKHLKQLEKTEIFTFN